jgi:hypothetical protein
MIDVLLASTIIGQVVIGPNQIKTEYITDRNQVITIVETIQETFNDPD